MCPAPKGNKNAVGNEGGRPALFNSPGELQKAIDDYFNGGANKRLIIVGLGTMEIPCYTICGLAYYLGFVSRQSFYDYEKNIVFSDIIKKARLRIEMAYEERLADTGCTGAIFALKNMDWHDKTETQHSGEIKGQPQIIVSSQSAAEALKKIADDSN